MARMSRAYLWMKASRFCIPKKFRQSCKDLETQMGEAADNLQFEFAAVLRDKIAEIRHMTLQKKS